MDIRPGFTKVENPPPEEMRCRMGLETDDLADRLAFNGP